MTIDERDAQVRALAFLENRFRRSIELVPVSSLPAPVYGLDTAGWYLFAVRNQGAHQIGGSEHIAVNRTSGEVRELGMLGQ